MKLTTYDGLTDSTIEKELTGKANENLTADIAQLASEKLAREQLRTSNAIAKTALLERLGITAEEAALLLS
jgi:hypothetical protein